MLGWSVASLQLSLCVLLFGIFFIIDLRGRSGRHRCPLLRIPTTTRAAAAAAELHRQTFLLLQSVLLHDGQTLLFFDGALLHDDDQAVLSGHDLSDDSLLYFDLPYDVVLHDRKGLLSTASRSSSIRLCYQHTRIQSTDGARIYDTGLLRQWR